MKWARRYRARLRAAFRAARGAWYARKALPDMSTLTVHVSVSDSALEGGDPRVPVSVAESAYAAALRSTRKRMGLA